MKSSSYTKASQKKQQLVEDKEDHSEIKEKKPFLEGKKKPTSVSLACNRGTDSVSFR